MILVGLHREEVPIDLQRLSYFRKADELVGTVTATALAGTEFETWKRHEGLVAEGGTAEECQPQLAAAADERMVKTDMT